MLGFDFGANWSNYSAKALDMRGLDNAKHSIMRLLDSASLADRSFLDIGCGSGIFSVVAKQLGAKRVLGIDVNQTAVETSEKNAGKFLGPDKRIDFRRISVLDEAAMNRLGRYDIVYAWGSLHHTGALWKAIDKTCEHVSKEGTMILAIYNKHWTSPVWHVIKQIYNHSPKFIRQLMIGFFYVSSRCVVWVTGWGKRHASRGMDFYYDVVDWIGGYPYEYASKKQVVEYVTQKGFRLKKIFPADTPTGNHEYIFQK